MEAISDFIHQPPGCRQGTSLEPVARHYCPATKRGALRAFGILDRQHDPMVTAERLGGAVAGAQQHTRAITARTDQPHRARRSRRTRHDHCMHGASTAHTPRSRHSCCGHVTAHAADMACVLQPQRARFDHGARYGHGMHVSLAARTALHCRRCEQSGPELPDCLGSASDAARAAERIAKLPQAGPQGS